MNYRAIRDPLWKHIFLPEPLAEALSTADFIRLSRIRQLGPTEIVYPGATHSRAAHSLGVYGIARKMLEILEQRGAGDWITPQGKISWYSAALFHDIGHFPYTHSLKELPLEEHEALSARIVLKPEIARCIQKAGGDPEQTAAIIDKQRETDNKETLFYRKLLSGVLDPDKLDYLNRDAYYCGVPYGIQDTEYTLDQLQPDMERGIVLSGNAIVSVENLLFSKYLMYRSVYWHKQVRIATAMMKKAVYAALTKKFIPPEDLYQQDDEGIHHVLESIAHNPKTKKDFPEIVCSHGVHTRELFTVVAEIPFDVSDPLHFNLQDLEIRVAAERHLAEEAGIGYENFLIDIPEPISFESDLWIFDEEKPFSRSSTVFSPRTVASFTGSLRKIRCAVKSDMNNKVLYKKIESFFNMSYN